MSTLTVVGLQWGDEGKGKVVDLLAANAAHVARFQGGHNAGHTLVVNGRKVALHLLPSGILHPNAQCYIGTGVVVSPAALLEEINILTNDNISLEGRLLVSDAASLVLDYHVMLDKQRESHKHSIGTTLRGIGPAHEDKIARRAIRLYDLYNGSLKDKLAVNADLYSSWLDKKIDVAILYDDLQQQAEQLKPLICQDIAPRLANAAKRGDNILLEGAQAVMLDIEQGTYPFTTSAQCLPSAAASGLGVSLSSSILGVSKVYATRVGNGLFPTELLNPIGQLLGKHGGEFGATTGRQRRCGWIDIPMLRHALLVSGVSNIALTKLDVFDVLDNIAICVNYECDGKILHYPPLDPIMLAKCKPIYETFSGWMPHRVADITDFSQLPDAAKNYINRISELTNTSVDIISTGAKRESTIILRAPFLTTD